MPGKKIKVGIYLPNKHIADVKLSNPEDGNPGIGGTQFLLWSLPYYIDKFYKGRFEFIIFAENKEFLIGNFEILAVTGLIDAARKAKEGYCDLMIFRPCYDRENIEFLHVIEELELKSVAWMHNTPMFLLNHLHKNRFIKRCICVGREQYEKFRDHPLFNKISLIFNAVDSTNIPYNKGIAKTKSIVFIGSLEFAKGFHHFARMWKEILVAHPDAHLNVIGSGKLYDRSRQFGKLGIADKKYEEAISRYICDKNGNILGSINFLGLLDTEKYEIMSKACAGLSNHPYVSETFCLAAVEFQLCGTPVVSMANGGLLDTVEDGVGGFLPRNLSGIKDKLNLLLSDLGLSSRMGEAGRNIVKEKFNYENISKEWVQLIDDVYTNSGIRILEVNQLNETGLKKVRERLRVLKIKYPIFRILLPSIYILHTIEYLKLKLDKLSLRYLL